MKAQARKILALIMAMVMCLSLAAPAFAEAEEAAAESSAPAEVVEVQEADDEKKLEVQQKQTDETKEEYDLEYDDETGAYTIKDKAGNAVAAGNLKDATQANKDVTVTLVTPATDKIGLPPQAAEYKVTYKYSSESERTVEWTNVKVGKDTGATKSVYDVADADWADLGNARVFAVGEGQNPTRYQVKGSVYQESQGNGLVLTYFKLYKVDSNKVFQTDKDPVYLVNTTARGAIGATDNDGMSEALAGAVTCNEYGKTNATGYGTPITTAGVTITADTEEADVIEAYDFAVMNLVDLTDVRTSKSTVTGNKQTDKAGTLGPVFFAADKLTGSFQVSIEDKKQEFLNSKKGNTDKVFVTDVATAESIVKKQLTDCTVESVVAATGNYFTVTVSTTAASKKLVATDSELYYGKNVAIYEPEWNGTDKVWEGTAVLVDLSKDGFYNASSNNGANGVALAANTEALGPVVVRVSDVERANAQLKTTTTDDSSELRVNETNYYVFKSVANMKKAFEAVNCKDLKAIPYAQVVLNPWNDTKQNKLVDAVVKGTKVEKAYYQDRTNDLAVIKLADNWYSSAWNTPNADFVKKGEFEVDAVGHGPKYEVTEITKASTCKTPGSKIVRSICTICGNTVSEKTEEIPAITDPVETNTEDEAQAAIDGKTYKKVAFGTDDTNVTNEANKHKTNHWIEKSKTETTVSADKSETIVTTTYTCNLGEVHTELERKISVKKNNLQHSGRWNHFGLEELTALETYNGTISDVPGYKAVTVVDSDVDYEGMPLNRSKDGDWSGATRNDKLSAGIAGHMLPDIRYEAVTNTGDIFFHFDVQNMTKDDSGFQKAADNTWTKSEALLVNNVYATSKSLPATKAYAAKLTVKNLVKPQFACQTGSATFEVEVYDVTEAAKAVLAEQVADPYTYYTYMEAQLKAEIEGTKLENNLKDKKVTLLKTYKQDVTMKATKEHDFSMSTTGTTSVCRICGEEKQVAPDLVITATAKDLTYTGTAVQPKITVVDKDGYTLIKNIDYVVSETDETSVGTHYVTVKGVDAYAGNRLKVPFNITKGKNPMTLKSTSKTIKYKMTKKVKKVKKKKKITYVDNGIAKTTFTIKTKNAQGTVTWKSSDKNITVNKKGKVTVKKGTKAGTYTITATAGGNENYKAGSAQTFTLTLKATK